MKNTLIVALILFSVSYNCRGQSLKTTLSAQPYNHKIPLCNYVQYPDGLGNSNGRHKKTIIHDDNNNIFFLATDNVNGGIEIIKLNPVGTFNTAVHILNNSNDHDFVLTPVNLIHTFDDGVLLVGNYYGDSWLGYPITPGPISTIFYAKFDNNLSLVSFKLHYGYPLSADDPTRAIWCDGVTSIPSSQEYVILANTGTDISLIKLDVNEAPIQETHIPYPINDNLSPLSLLGLAIDYLPNNNIIAIAVKTDDDDISATPWSLGGGIYFPGLFTIDPSLSTTSPLTVVHFSNSEEQVGEIGCSFYQNNETTNIIEDYSDIDNLIWGFGLQVNAGCGYTRSFTILKHDVTTLNITAHQIYGTCDANEIPVEIYNNPYDDGIFTVGITEAITFPVPPWMPPSGYAQSPCLNLKPALLNIEYNTLSPNNLFRYNTTDYSFWNDPVNGNGYNFNKLESFSPFYGNLTDPSFILHVTDITDNTPHDNEYTRIINARYDNSVPCSTEEAVYTNTLDPSTYQYNLEPEAGYYDAVEIYPETDGPTYTIEPCTDPSPKTSDISNENQIKNRQIKIYPNPTVNGNIYVEGDFSELHDFILEDITGRIIYKKQAYLCKKMNFDLSAINNGLYTLKIFKQGKLEKIEKIVVN